VTPAMQRIWRTMFEWIFSMRNRPLSLRSTSSLFRTLLLCWVSCLALDWFCGRIGAAEVPNWHCDGPALSPDGTRVAYLQWDSALVRIVVVNLDQPDQRMYFNLGKDWEEPVSIFWKTPQTVELRKGNSTFASFTVDPRSKLSDGAPVQSDQTALPPLDRPAIQVLLQRQLPHRSIQILNWDDAGCRVLLLADAPNVPGRFFVYDRSHHLLFEVARRKTLKPSL
jgi:hypothetical protein